MVLLPSHLLLLQASYSAWQVIVRTKGVSGLQGETSKCSFLLAKKKLHFADNLVLDAENGNMAAGTGVNLVREVSDGVNVTCTAYETRRFTVNEDGTVSPQTAPELVLAMMRTMHA
jgi:hypothetical protein